MSQCEAIINDYENGTHYNLRRSYTSPKQRRCLKRASETRVSPLSVRRELCTAHARLADEGLLTVTGHVESRQTIRDVHNIDSLAAQWRQQNGWFREITANRHSTS